MNHDARGQVLGDAVPKAARLEQGSDPHGVVGPDQHWTPEVVAHALNQAVEYELLRLGALSHEVVVIAVHLGPDCEGHVRVSEVPEKPLTEACEWDMIRVD